LRVLFLFVCTLSVHFSTSHAISLRSLVRRGLHFQTLFSHFSKLFFFLFSPLQATCDRPLTRILMSLADCAAALFHHSLFLNLHSPSISSANYSSLFFSLFSGPPAPVWLRATHLPALSVMAGLLPGLSCARVTLFAWLPTLEFRVRFSICCYRHYCLLHVCDRRTRLDKERFSFSFAWHIGVSITDMRATFFPPPPFFFAIAHLV